MVDDSYSFQVEINFIVVNYFRFCFFILFYFIFLCSKVPQWEFVSQLSLRPSKKCTVDHFFCAMNCIDLQYLLGLSFLLSQRESIIILCRSGVLCLYWFVRITICCLSDVWSILCANLVFSETCERRMLQWEIDWKWIYWLQTLRGKVANLLWHSQGTGKVK